MALKKENRDSEKEPFKLNYIKQQLKKPRQPYHSKSASLNIQSWIGTDNLIFTCI